MKEALLYFDIADLNLLKRGKVRDVYHLEDGLLFIATDRISAFDSVLPNGIPDKGKILNSISAFWFEKTKNIVANHLITTSIQDMPLPESVDKALLDGRSSFVSNIETVPYECVVRGYMAGSAWREYQKTHSICGISLPEGLQLADRFPEPLFTPSTKADEGHDINVPFEHMVGHLGKQLAKELKSISLSLFRFASDYARERGLILTDTKFEFGMQNGHPVLIDELFTPDSSRFWKADTYTPGIAQDGLDKEFVRDFLRSKNWTGDGPAPRLPDEIVKKTRARYIEVYQAITGIEFE